MTTPEDIADQQELLAIHRRTLQIYLRQMARMGHAHVPPATVHGIQEARGHIQRIKDALRDWDVAVDDLPNDTEVEVINESISSAYAHEPSSSSKSITTNGDGNTYTDISASGGSHVTVNPKQPTFLERQIKVSFGVRTLITQVPYEVTELWFFKTTGFTWPDYIEYEFFVSVREGCAPLRGGYQQEHVLFKKRSPLIENEDDSYTDFEGASVRRTYNYYSVSDHTDLMKDCMVAYLNLLDDYGWRFTSTDKELNINKDDKRDFFPLQIFKIMERENKLVNNTLAFEDRVTEEYTLKKRTESDQSADISTDLNGKDIPTPSTVT